MMCTGAREAATQRVAREELIEAQLGILLYLRVDIIHQHEHTGFAVQVLDAAFYQGNEMRH